MLTAYLFVPLFTNHPFQPIKAVSGIILQGNKRSAGFTVEERESFERLILANGFVDTFRRQHPKAVGYTYWGYRFNSRAVNRGECLVVLLFG